MSTLKHYHAIFNLTTDNLQTTIKKQEKIYQKKTNANIWLMGCYRKMRCETTKIKTMASLTAFVQLLFLFILSW